jgi:hypothetical protein
MSPLLLIIMIAGASFLANFVSWFLAGRRTLCMQRLDAKKTMSLVFAEDLVPYLAIGGLLLAPTMLGKVVVALSGAAGGAIGAGLAILIEKRALKKIADAENDAKMSVMADKILGE